MMQHISWADFFTALSVVLGIYYLFVLVVYYRQELQSLFSGGSRPAPPPLPAAAMPPMAAARDSEAELSEQQYEEATKLVSELQSLLDEGYIKEELILALQLKLRLYQHLKQTPFAVSIMNYISSESEKRSIPLEEHELRALW